MNDTNKIAAEARKAIALALCIDLSPEGEAEIDAIIQAACEKAYQQGRTDREREIYGGEGWKRFGI